MGYLRSAQHILTGTASGDAVGTAKSGSAVFLGTGARKLEHLSSQVTVDAETDTFTWAHRWQVSNDATNWFTVANAPQNPAGVVLATGTGDPDAAVTRGVAAPAAVHGFKFARAQLITGGETGTSDDTFSIGYAYRALGTGEDTDGRQFFNAHILTGTATGVAPGSQVNGNPVFMGQMEQRAEFLSALVTCDAETNTITLSAAWEGSNDRSTWTRLATSPQNAAAVALATGTAGADDPVTRVIPAPESAYSYKFARLALLVGAVTGTNNDTYSIAYCYRAVESGGRE